MIRWAWLRQFKTHGLSIMKNNTQKKLNELIKIYSKNLPDKIQQIILQWNELQEHWDWGTFQDFHREVHSLCGSAGTYGYPELSRVAREIEIFFKTILAKKMISSEEKKLITNYLNQLLIIPAIEQPKNEAFLDEKNAQSEENKHIYIMEQDKVLSRKLISGLRHVGFEAYPIQDMPTLHSAVKEKLPIAIIIDTHYLDRAAIQLMQDLQSEQPTPIQVFCLIPDAELMPRLMAIRAGCQAFFQKPVDVSQIIQLVYQKCGIYSDAPIRILILDDSKSLVEYYSLILTQAGMSTKAITNPMQLLKELESFQPDLLLMDVYMPECTGFELAAILRQESNYTKIPIIFLSTEEDKDKKLFAISLGGDDFLTKPVSPQYLISAVRSRSKRASILNYYMTTDSLTGLLNHSNILKQFDIQLSRAQSDNLPLSFIMIDIDNFKKVNDCYGHQVGDEVIQKLAELFLSRLRGQESVGRYGGEEFVLILPGSNLDETIKRVNELRSQFSQHKFKVEDTSFFVTFSAGISCFDGANSASEMIEKADAALYKAKLLGRNKVLSFQ